MTPYRRHFLRLRFLKRQQTQLAEDAKLADPAGAYRKLLEELGGELSLADAGLQPEPARVPARRAGQAA